MTMRFDPDLARQVLKDPLHWPAFGFGLGLLPIAPGTWGSLLGVLLFWILIPLELPVYLGVVAAFFLVGIWISGESARRIGVHDHPGIVWDEVVGMMLTLPDSRSSGPPIYGNRGRFGTWITDCVAGWALCSMTY
jgi:phosphatidylglycerophosphatase A